MTDLPRRLLPCLLLGLTPPAFGQDTADLDLGLFGRDGNTAWLLLAVFLLLWLLTRVHRRERARLRPPPRRSPVTPDELARSVFEAARNEDVHAYRGLFLMGREVAEVMGSDAEQWMEGCSLPLLRPCVLRMRQAIPDGATYGGVEMVGAHDWAFLARLPGGESVRIPFGRAVRIGAILRLVEGPKA